MNPVRFGKYFLQDMIASGGMAEIYKASVKSMDGSFHTLAIKRILPQFSKDEEFISLLTDEAKVMVFMNHPNIVSIVEFGRVEGSYYIAMEYVDGPTLQSVFRKVREQGDQFPIYLALYIVREVAAGLGYAHRKLDPAGKPLDLVHRDISPGNILISSEGDIKITDFGISKVANQDHHTQVGVIRGKTGYMSPEQTRAGVNIDSRTDLFALGIILYELLTGERLFKADSVPQALKMIREGKIPSLRGLRPEIHPNLENIALKALSQDPEERFQTGEEFSDAINEFLTKFYTGQGLKRVTHNDLMEYVGIYFPKPRGAPMALPSGEDTLNTDEDLPAGDAAADPSSKVYAVNPLFSLEPQEDVASRLKRAKPQGGPDKPDTESLIEAPKGTMASMGSIRVTPKRAFLGAMLALSAAVWLAFDRYDKEIMEWIRPSAVEILVDSRPSGAKITIDQQEWPTPTPAKVKLMRGSEVQIILSKEGYQKIARLVTVERGVSPVLFDLVADHPVAQGKEATVTIQSEPSGAEVYLDERPTGSKTPFEFTVEVGKARTIRLELPGYRSKTTSIELDRADKLVKSIVLVKDRAPPTKVPVVAKPKVKIPKLGEASPAGGRRKINLSVNTTPWSEVYLDGAKIGVSPFVGARVTQGKHRLRFVNNQLKTRPFEVAVEFTSEAEVRCIYDLTTRVGGCK